MIAPGITLYLLRHGETEWNTQRRFQGSKNDSPLTQRGIAQARAVAALLAECVRGDPQFVSSPAPRAQRTTEIILDALSRTGEYEIEPRINELDLGEWSGLTREEAQTNFPEVWKARNADRWNVPVPKGESYAMVAERAKDWLGHLSRDTVAVSHGGFGRIVRGLYGGLDANGIAALDEPQDCVFRLADGSLAMFGPAKCR